MATLEKSKVEVRRALADLGWEVRVDDGESGAVMGGYGKYHLMVSFGDEGPTSVIISYVGSGGQMLSSRWPGVERLPTPRSAVRALSHPS